MSHVPYLEWSCKDPPRTTPSGVSIDIIDIIDIISIIDIIDITCIICSICIMLMLIQIIQLGPIIRMMWITWIPIDFEAEMEVKRSWHGILTAMGCIAFLARGRFLTTPEAHGFPYESLQIFTEPLQAWSGSVKICKDSYGNPWASGVVKNLPRARKAMHPMAVRIPCQDLFTSISASKSMGIHVIHIIRIIGPSCIICININIIQILQIIQVISIISIILIISIISIISILTPLGVVLGGSLQDHSK